MLEVEEKKNKPLNSQTKNEEKNTMIKNKQIKPMKATDIVKTNKELGDN